MDESLTDTVDDIISQLQSSTKQTAVARIERDPIKKEDLEDFVIKTGSELVQDALETVQIVRGDILAAPDDKNIEALASLITATSNAIDGLNKLVASTKKNETVLKVKEMDISSKKELQAAEGQIRVALTREEVFKALLNNSKPIEAEIVSDKRIEN